MANALIFEVRGSNIPEDLNAPLSEEEIAQVERFIEKVRSGDYNVTSDPEERDKFSEGKNVVWSYRREL